ncbi:MAG: HAD hydrolase family protein [Desulfovibrionaceae bacterium]|nr:HAD hydrolase family protein [Desulfovibrionaceae bacterium]
MRAEDLARKIRLLILDVDGVLTDGGLYYDQQGSVLKRFNVQDGLGVKLAQSAGLGVAVITGLNHGCVEARVRELGIKDYYPGNHKKVPFMERLRRDKDLDYSQIAYLGDDLVDMPVLRLVGLPMAVINASKEIVGMAAWVSARPGGHGAVREAIEFILHSQGLFDVAWRRLSG